MFNVSPKRTVLPGFNFRPQDDVPGFNMDDDGLPPRESTWPDELFPGSAPPQYPASAQALTPIQPAPPQPQDWPYQTLAMPLPASPSLVDLLNQGPYGTLINPIKAYPTTGQEQWPSFNAPPPQSDLDTRDDSIAVKNANPPPASEEAMRNTWPPSQGLQYAQVGFAGPRDLSGAGVMWQPSGAPPTPSIRPTVDSNFVLANADDYGVEEAQQPKPLPPNQQMRPQRPPPSGSSQSRTPPAPRVPERPGMEMTELERRREQEFAVFNEKYRQLKEVERRQPIWDGITRRPPPVIVPGNKLQGLLPDNWQETFDPRYVAWTRAAAARSNIPLELLARLLYKESNYNKDQVSPSGARGIAQLTPGAVESVGLDPSKFNYSDPKASIDAGAAYLAQQYRRFKNWPKAAAAYNAGGGYVAGWLEGVSPDWSAMPEAKQPLRWKHLQTYLQYIFRGEPEYFDK